MVLAALRRWLRSRREQGQPCHHCGHQVGAAAPLAGCFYGLSQPELTVINPRRLQRAGTAHTAASTAPGHLARGIRLVERQALQRLNGLALTRGCGATTELVGAVTVVNGFIGPAEIAISPALIAFGNPGYQGMGQSSFASLGQVPPLRSPGPLPAGSDRCLQWLNVGPSSYS